MQHRPKAPPSQLMLVPAECTIMQHSLAFSSSSAQFADNDVHKHKEGKLQHMIAESELTIREFQSKVGEVMATDGCPVMTAECRELVVTTRSPEKS